MTVPGWMWAALVAGLVAVVAAEVILTGRRPGSFTWRSAVTWIVVYVSLAALFGLSIGVVSGWLAAGQFYAGYLTEYSLSLDNLFIFYVIMKWFTVLPARQPRVLLLGIGLALVLRSALIVAGAAAINRYDWLFYPLGGILVWTAIGLITGGHGQPEEQHTRLMSWLRRRVVPAQAGHGDRLIVWRSGRLVATPMLLLVIAIGVVDLVFAFDSIPAVFGITTSAYVIVACNAFALMGLRQLYVLLAGALDRIYYLNTGLAIICAFIGVKLLLHALHGSGAGWAAEIPAWLSIVIVATVLLITVIAGILRNPRAMGREEAAGSTPPPNADEGATLERRFTVVDTDGNGVWQRDDCELITRRLCERLGHAIDSAAGRAVATGQRTLFGVMLSYMDANGDDEISREEFVAAVGRAVADRPGFDAALRTTAQTLIQVADQDGNGVLDAGEYTRLAAVYGASSDEAARTFAHLDLDRNGFLDTTEVTLAISKFFTSRDVGACGNVA